MFFLYAAFFFLTFRCLYNTKGINSFCLKILYFCTVKISPFFTLSITNNLITHNHYKSVEEFAESQGGGSSKKNQGKAAKGGKRSGKTSSFSLWAFLSGNKMVVFYGIVLMLFSILLFLSVFSFYFNAHENVSFVVGDHSQNVSNLAKGVGG